jgi:1-acyl-sn-glycerol-3-phosphate acyltransferase
MVTVSTFRMILPFMVNRKLLGSANVPIRAPFLVVSESATLVSLMAIACEFPLPLYAPVARRALKAPAIGRFLRDMNALPAETESSVPDFSPPLRVLRNGGSVAIFLPEVNDPAAVTEVLVSAGMLACESAVPVVPVQVSFPPGSPGRLLVKVGPPARFAGTVAGLSLREKYLTVGKTIQSLLPKARS